MNIKKNRKKIEKNKKISKNFYNLTSPFVLIVNGNKRSDTMGRKTNRRNMKPFKRRSLNKAKLRAIELIQNYPDFYSRERIISNFMYLDMKDKGFHIPEEVENYIKNDGLGGWKKAMKKSGFEDMDPNFSSKLQYSGYKYAKNFVKDKLIKEITGMDEDASFGEITRTLIDEDIMKDGIPQQEEKMHMVEFDLFDESDEIKIEEIN